MNGYRITGYGYAVYKAMESALGSGLDELDQLQNKWNDYWLGTTIRSSVPIDSEFILALDTAKDLIHGIENSVAAWKRYKVVKKKTVTVKNAKTSKQPKPPFTTKTTKRTYRLVVDRKHKAAWFECHGKIVPVHAYVKQSTSDRFGASTEPVTMHTSKLVPKPKSALRHSQVYEHPCPGCGHRVYGYVVVDDYGTIKLRCVHCSAVSIDPAPFLILNNRGSENRKLIISLDGGGALGPGPAAFLANMHPNAIGAAQVAQNIRNQLGTSAGTSAVARGILKDLDSKVKIVDLDSILDDGGGDDDNKSEKRKWFKLDPRHPKLPLTEESEQGDL
jgi:hypothetical protein